MCRRYELPAFDSPWHFHPEVELTYIVSSTGTRFTGDCVERFSAGDLILLGPNLPHYWCNDEPARETAEMARSVVIIFDPAFLGDAFLAAPEMSRVRTLLKRASRGLSIERQTHQRIREQMEQIVEAAPAQRLVMLLGMLVALSQAPEDDLRPLTTVGYRPTLSTHDCERLDRVHQYVIQHLEDDLDLGTAADLVHMSPSAFCRYFKRHTSKSFVQFVNELRVGRACRELMETERQISDIALQCGFNTISNFNRRFRRITGRTPRDYRRLHTASG